ncbi:MAG TPA: hypothetical protein PKE04_11705 [Clostridia bacterium]|nr:hypothetical protein [Clostridia bacterium]
MEGITSQRQSLLRRAILPLLYAAALVLVCNRIAGSYFIEIEDRYASMVFGGAYGAYDPYVPAIHPLLGRLIAFLYGLAPAVNWLGVLLLALVGIAGATAISLAARRPGGLIPGLVVLTPILVVLTCSLQSQVVAALCLVPGALSVLDGFQDGRAGIRRVLLGVALCVLGAMLAMGKLWLLALCVLLCGLVALWRNKRRAALIAGIVLVIVSVIVPSLLGMLDGDWLAYHRQYMAYERAQQSPLREQVDALLNAYGVEH